MSITSVNSSADITDGQLDVEIQMGEAITGSSATVTINNELQLNVAVDNVSDKILFNHRLGDMVLNSKGETAHILSVDFINEVVEVVVAYGQSNTFGWKTADLNPNDTVTESATDILMMNSGKTALIQATKQIPSDETASLAAGDSDCMLDFANYFRNYFNARGTTDLEQVLQVSGLGSSAVTDLADGTTPFTNWESDFTTLCGLITTAGKVPHVSTILYTQGEKDVNTSVETGWASRVATTIYDPMIAHIKTTTGQADDPIMQVAPLTMHSNYTTNGQDYNEIALEQLELQDLRPGRVKATVHTGWLEHSADGIHYSGKGQRYMRQMQAKFAAYTDLKPLTASHARRASSTIELRVNGGTGNLQFDYTTHASTTAKGIRVFNNVAAAVTISSVTLDNTNSYDRRIVVTLADGGTNGPYTIDGSYFSDNGLGGGQYHANIVPITDSDTRDGVLSDSATIGNQTLTNPLMPFNLTASEP